MRKPILLATAITLAIASLCFILGALIAPIKPDSMLGDFANIAQIIEGVVALALLVSVYIVAAEIRESVRARHLDGMRYVRGLIGTEEASDNRKWVYQELKKTSWPLPSESVF